MTLFGGGGGGEIALQLPNNIFLCWHLFLPGQSTITETHLHPWDVNGFFFFGTRSTVKPDQMWLEEYNAAQRRDCKPYRWNVNSLQWQFYFGSRKRQMCSNRDWNKKGEFQMEHWPGSGARVAGTGHPEPAPDRHSLPQGSHGSWPSYSTRGRSLQSCLLMSLAHQKKSVSPQERWRTGTLLKVKAPPGGLDMLQRPLHNLKNNKDTNINQSLKEVPTPFEK